MYPQSSWRYLMLVCLVTQAWEFFGLVQPLVAAPPISIISYDRTPLDLELVKNPSLAFRSNKVITADTIENFPNFRKTMPSLWWTQEQLPKKLVLNWLVYPEEKRIDLIVNPQFWNNLEYIDRYQLINNYGSVARRYDYNVRIFNLKFSEVKPIVAYTCGYGRTPLRCIIEWQEISQRSIQVTPAK
jgi:hypothetical protein